MLERTFYLGLIETIEANEEFALIANPKLTIRVIFTPITDQILSHPQILIVPWPPLITKMALKTLGKILRPAKATSIAEVVLTLLAAKQIS